MYNLTIPVIKSKFTAHNRLKKDLLQKIELSPGSDLITKDDKISKTDWNVAVDIHRPYLDIFTAPIVEDLKVMYQSFKSTGFQIHNFWYQQYYANDVHNWHTHQSAQFTNIYYLEMPDISARTQILNPADLDHVIELEVEEGDIISFPAFVYHRSPPVGTMSRKTIVSFNTSILSLQK